MAPLIRQEAVLDMDNEPSAIDSRVSFSAPIIGAPEVKLSVVRWDDMGRPGQIRVTIEPISGDRKWPEIPAHWAQ